MRENVAAGDREKALFDIADLLVSTLEVAEPKDVSTLVRQLRETLKDIAGLPRDAERDIVDELAERRVDRRPNAPNRKPAGGSRKPRVEGGSAG